jgi:hypothetical protein
LRVIYERYRKAKKREEKVILSEFCANAGYHRKYSIRLLNGPRPERCKREPRRGRGVSYSQEVVALLTAVWETAGYPWSVRLKALFPLWMPWIRKHDRVRPEMERQLFADECAADGPAAEGPEDAPASTTLWADQARVFAEAPHSGEDRSLGCEQIMVLWIAGSGFPRTDAPPGSLFWR